MAIIPLDSEHASHCRERFDRLRPDSKRVWGSMSPTKVLAHLTFTLEMSLGEREVEGFGNFLTRNTFVWWLAVCVMPWPRGKLKAPDSFTPDPTGDFQAERTRCLAALDRFVAARTSEPNRTTYHPFCGDLALRRWGYFHGRHLDHHLRQFGG